jgi:spore coat polysaccharide biosynthesis protein SpsF (cytidylyltransferase family)
MGIHYRRLLEYQINKIKKRTFSYHIKVKTSNMQNKKKILEAAREKCQLTYKDNPSE